MSSGTQNTGLERDSEPTVHNEVVQPDAEREQEPQDPRGDSFTARHFFMRSSQVPRPDGVLPQPCRCCPDGDHRFCGGLRIEPAMRDPYSSTRDLTIDGWLDLWVYRNARHEGKLIRVTLEVIEEPAPVALMPVME